MYLQNILFSHTRFEQISRHLGLEYLASSCQERGTESGFNGRRENHLNGTNNDPFGVGEGEGEEGNEDNGQNEGGVRGSERRRGRERVGEDDEETTEEEGAAGRIFQGMRRGRADGGGRQMDGQGQGKGKGQSESQDSQESNFTVIEDMEREMERDIEIEREREREKERARQMGWPGVSVPCLRGVVYFEGIGDIADIQAPLPRAQVRIGPDRDGVGCMGSVG
jgi:hypothetical protein